MLHMKESPPSSGQQMHQYCLSNQTETDCVSPASSVAIEINQVGGSSWGLAEHKRISRFSSVVVAVQAVNSPSSGDV